MKILLVTAMAVALVIPLSAHHSFAAEYDSSKPIFMQGKVTKIEWMNPHARFYLDVKDDKGNVTNWEMEMGSPNGLMRQGWLRNAMKVGDIVNVEAYAAKDGTNLGNVRRVKLTDGRRLFAGSSNDGGPQP
ncbi:MAG: hypothetical protein JO323_15045 [Acidobacteriia bacterium]|nr:hypothetical protein [Terriglobia bacterium]